MLGANFTLADLAQKCEEKGLGKGKVVSNCLLIENAGVGPFGAPDGLKVFDLAYGGRPTKTDGWPVDSLEDAVKAMVAMVFKNQSICLGCGRLIKSDTDCYNWHHVSDSMRGCTMIPSEQPKPHAKVKISTAK